MSFCKLFRPIAAALLATIAATVSAQDAPRRNPLLTQRGWEVGGQISKYKYEEPGLMSLEGNRLESVPGLVPGFVGAYTGTNEARVYARIDLRVSYGELDYESVGTGTLSDVPDYIVEVRVVVGRDFLVGERFALSPYVGLGYRYLYNDLRGTTSTGAVGYQRYSQYWYAPIGLTTRIRMGAQWAFAPTIEYDAFIGGKQKSYLTDTGIGFSDASNDQDRGRGYRVYLMFESRRWAFGPWLHYWNIKDSNVVPIGGGFGAVEPDNTTTEYGLELRYRF